MKRIIRILLFLILSFCLSAYGNPVSANDSHAEVYVGEYEQNPVFQKLKQIESCTDPNILCQLLSEIYDGNFSYIKLEYDANSMTYKEPYEDFVCTAIPLYNRDLYRVPISSDTYLFFNARGEELPEEPSFVMDSDGTYIVSKYEIKNFDDGTHCHSISSWIITDLFMCLHEYNNAEAEQKAFMREAVSYMEWYISFENLIIDSLNENTGNITKIESLKPSIDILSFEIIGPTKHELNVEFLIRNISKERGIVYLTCSGHSYQDEMHFNDENFRNDYREDGCFDYNVYYGGGEKPTTLAIFYGYGEFDIYEGWDNECMTTITLLYAEDYGEISSGTIPNDQIHPLYFEGEYVGAWTTHESRDLIEIGGNSTSAPFEKHSTFISDEGLVVSVEIANSTPIFTINNTCVGAPSNTYEYEGVVFYDLWYNNESIFINRYPNDESIRLQGSWSLIGNRDIYLYP